MKLIVSYKYILISFCVILPCLYTACNEEVKKEEAATGIESAPGRAPVMLFKEETHNFGTITQGEKVSYSFIFKNTGGSDLVISSANGSCGCTVPTFPEEPVKAGEEAKIDVVFDSDGKSGMVEKTVTLISNCNPNTKILTINSNIIVPEEEEE